MGSTVIFPGFCYRYPENGAPPSADSYILAAFAAAHRLGSCLDLCSGAGLLSFLLLGRGAACRCTCVDIDPGAVSLCGENARQLRDASAVTAVQADVAGGCPVQRVGSFDSCVCNPPYHTESTGTALTRTECTCTLHRVVHTGAASLRNGGRLFLCMRASRMAELLNAFTAADVAPKRLLLAAHTPEKKPFLVVCEGVKGAAAGLEVLPLLSLFETSGRPSAASDRIYYEGWSGGV